MRLSAVICSAVGYSGFPDKQSQVDRPTGRWLDGWVDGQMDVYIENVQTLIYYRI